MFSIVDDTDGKYKLVHRINYPNKNTAVSTHNPILPGCAMVANGTTGEDIVLRSSSLGGFIEGPNTNLGPIFAEDASSAVVEDTELPILTLRNRTTYQSDGNTIQADS